jgi:hypothetical protein
MRIGEYRAKGYFKADVLNLCRRYISVSEFEALLDEDKEEGAGQSTN